MDDDTEHGEGFNPRQARLPDFYPAGDVLAEIGRVAMAATRVDSQLAMLLLAVRYPRAGESRVSQRNTRRLIPERTVPARRNPPVHSRDEFRWRPPS